VRVPAVGLGLYRVVVSFPSGPFAGEVAVVRNVRVAPPLPVGKTKRTNPHEKRYQG